MDAVATARRGADVDGPVERADPILQTHHADWPWTIGIDIDHESITDMVDAHRGLCGPTPKVASAITKYAAASTRGSSRLSGIRI